jgi:hypothetical protein
LAEKSEEKEQERESYEARLATLSDIELLREQSENFAELTFFQIKLEDIKKETGDEETKSKLVMDFENSAVKIKQNIQNVKREIERRDEITSSRVSMLHRAIEESHVIVLAVETLRELIRKEKEEWNKTMSPNRARQIDQIIDQIVESNKENIRLVEGFARMSLKKEHWVESKLAELSK